MTTAPIVTTMALVLAVSACNGPVRAVRVGREAAQRDLTHSVVTTGELSWATRDVLLERGLSLDYDHHPEHAIAALHASMVASNGDPDLLFALAELSFLHGEAAEKSEYRMAAAVYAYAFLFPDDGPDDLPPFDPRPRIASDLYNWALGAAFVSEDGSEVVPRSGTFALPAGQITVTFDPAARRAGDRELYRFVPVAELAVDGLEMRYRSPGIGAPLAASTRPLDTATTGVHFIVAPELEVPVTALLRIAGARRALVEQKPLTATLELHVAWDGDTVTIAGRSVPLESEPTAALALTFNDMPITEIEIMGFLGRLPSLTQQPPLISATPYRPGRIPVVFVHGTASSPVRWAEMFNRLQADKDLSRRYQFWFFQYDSDEPIALSALHLRDALVGAVKQIDPDGTDPALRDMVLIGHSQGGLLVKMQTISSGERLWNAVSQKPLDELDLSEETRGLLRRGLFVEPLPGVTRVVFISTPHRGSFVAGHRIVEGLAAWLTNLPLQVVGLSEEIAENLDLVTAVDNMSPGHPFIQGLQEVPVVPNVTAHSIISVDGDGPAELGDDGVVAYSSANIDGVQSMVVVRSPHSCQGNPHTIEEVRRILRLHAGLPPSERPLGTNDPSRVPAAGAMEARAS